MRRALHTALTCLVTLLLVIGQAPPLRAAPASPGSVTHAPGAPCESATVDTATAHLSHSLDGAPAAAAADHDASLCAALCAVASQMGLPVTALPASRPPTLPAPRFFQLLALGEAPPPATPPPIR